MPEIRAGPPSPPTPPPIPNERLTAADLFDSAADLPPDQRGAFLDDRCAGNPALRREVESLLRYADTDDGELLSRTARFIPASPTIPQRVGPYRIVRVIGEGGMGVVYEAVQEQPRRTVALKVLRSPLASAHLIRRFEHEAEVLGQLKHPGIAQIYEAGSVETGFGRQPFFAMELINGLPLNRYASSRGLSVPERLELVARICDAFQHAHQKGVIHRDPKPANILVTDDGQPKILDFGVARATDADVRTVTRTEAGQLIGTLPYMSPEQVSGDPTNLDTRSDVYALGVILYELLSGSLPYELGTSIAEGARIIREQEARPLTSFDVAFRGDIATIAGKALQKEKERRYQSAAELAADIRRYLHDEPISARPPTAIYQLRKFARRNRALVGGAAATLAAILIGAIAASVLAVRAIRSEQRARVQAYRAGLIGAQGDLAASNSASAQRRLEAVPSSERGWEWRYLKWLSDRSLAVFPEPVVLPFAAPLELDGRELVVVGDGHTLSYWDPEQGPGTGSVIFRRVDLDAPATGGDSEPAGGLEFLGASPDNRLLLVCRASKAQHLISVLDAPTGRELWRSRDSIETPVAPFSHDSKRLVLGLTGQFRLSVRDAATGREVSSVDVDDSNPRAARFLAGDDALVVSTWAGTEVLAISGGSSTSDRGSSRPERVGPLAIRQGEPIGLENRLLGDWSGALVELDATTGERLCRWPGAEIGPYSEYALSRDAMLAAIADRRGAIALWRRPPIGQAAERRGRPDSAINPAISRDPELVTVLHGHADRIRSVVFSASGRRLLTIGASSVRVWDALSPPCPRVIDGGSDRGSTRAISADGRMVATFGWGSVRLWDVQTNRERWMRLAWRNGDPVPGAFSPDGSKVTLAGWDRQIATLSTDSSEVLWRRSDVGATPTALTWVSGSTGGDRIVVGDSNGGLTLRNEVGEVLSTRAAREGAPGRVVSLVAEPADGRFAAGWMPTADAAAARPTISIWSVSPLAPVLSLEQQPSRPDGAASPRGLAFSSDGTRLAAGFSDGAIGLWDARSGRLIRTVECGAGVLGVAFSPDGHRLLACCVDSAIRLYALPSLDEVLLLGATAVQQATFTPDGRSIVASGFDPVIDFEIAPDPGRTPDIARFSEAHTLALAVCESPGISRDHEAAINSLGLSRELRELVVKAAAAHGHQLNLMNSSAWGLARFKGRTEQEYGAALTDAETCCREWPGVRAFINTLGAAQYRAGQYENAIRSMGESDRLNRAAGHGLDPMDYVYIAMAHQRLGHAADAQRYLKMSLDAAPDSRNDPGEVGTVVREALELIGEPAR